MKLRTFLLKLLIFLPAICALAQSTPTGTPAYLNPALPIDQRVDDLVSRMTLEEKASQVVRGAVAIPRLHIPGYNWWTEGLHGVARAGTATVFPEPIGLGATFDTSLIKQMATVVGIEVRAKHEHEIRQENFTHVALDVWAPTINIVRDPRWGRGQETYGEDPFLTSKFAVAYVTGIQGDDPHYQRVTATPKHYAVHSGPEGQRHTLDVHVSKQDEEDTYLPAFRAAIVEGNSGAILCAYSSINGEPACINQFLLQDQLRDKWKFQGYLVTDCDSVKELQAYHFTQTLAEAAALAMKRGSDLDCTVGSDSSPFVDAVKQGLLPESVLDTSVKRLFRGRFQLGMFDPPEMVKYAQIPFSENDSEAHRRLSLSRGPGRRSVYTRCCVNVPSRNLQGAAESPSARSGSEVKARLFAERSGKPFLVLRDAAENQRILDLDGDLKPKVTVGRSDRADVAIGWDGEVSRLHAEIECVAGEWLVADDGLSSNGTFVNGQRVAGRRRLTDGDAALDYLFHRGVYANDASHRDADLMKRGEDTHDVDGIERVDVRRRFIREQDAGPVHHGTRNAEPLLLAAGKGDWIGALTA